MFETTHGRLTFSAMLAALTVGAHGVHGQTPAALPAAAAPMATFKSSVDLVRIAAVVRDQQGPVRSGSDDSRFRSDRRRAGPARSRTSARTSRASASRCCSTSAAAWKGMFGHAREAATHVLSWLDVTQDEAGVFRFDTRLEESMPFTSGLRTLPPALAGGDAVRRDVALRRHRAHGRARHRPRRPPPRRRRVHRRQRQREPADARRGVRHRERHRRARLHRRRRRVDRQPVVANSRPGRSKSPLAGPLVDLAELDRRARVRVEHAGGAQPGGAADRGGTAASVL